MIRNLTRGDVLARSPHIARSFAWRLQGMIGRRFSESLDAAVFPRCSSIHTCFMRQAIDVLFLDQQHVVRATVANLRPWRLAGCRGSAVVVELPAGTTSRIPVAIGDQLALEALPRG
jgi:uncharacterized membrane protein (UPF0127 family)